MRVLVVVFAVVSAIAQSTPVREGTIRTDDGVRLYYRQVGTGPQIVVVPVAVWLSPHLDRLATSNRRLVYYDPRGRGRSETGDLGRVSLDRATRDLENLRQGLGIERMALVGWSGYGLEMAAYALAHPDRVTRLVQLNPVPPRQEPFMTTRNTGMRGRVDGQAWARFQALSREGTDPKATCLAYNRATLPAFAAKPEAAFSTVDRMCELEAEWPDRQQKFFAAFMPSIAALDLRPRIPELRMPRLVIHGDRDLIPIDGVREWLQGDSADVRLVVVPDADHMSFLDQSDPVLQAIHAFLSATQR
jgi:proline iminopeptidase